MFLSADPFHRFINSAPSGETCSLPPLLVPSCFSVEHIKTFCCHACGGDSFTDAPYSWRCYSCGRFIEKAKAERRSNCYLCRLHIIAGQPMFRVATKRDDGTMRYDFVHADGAMCPQNAVKLDKREKCCLCHKKSRQIIRFGDDAITCMKCHYADRLAFAKESQLQIGQRFSPPRAKYVSPAKSVTPPPSKRARSTPFKPSKAKRRIQLSGNDGSDHNEGHDGLHQRSEGKNDVKIEIQIRK